MGFSWEQFCGVQHSKAGLLEIPFKTGRRYLSLYLQFFELATPRVNCFEVEFARLAYSIMNPSRFQVDLNAVGCITTDWTVYVVTGTHSRGFGTARLMCTYLTHTLRRVCGGSGATTCTGGQRAARTRGA